MTLICSAPLHPQARRGLKLFNARQFFESHEALEEAWRAESGEIRDLYKGILQVAVCYLHIMRNNYVGAVKMYARSQKLLEKWPQSCRGVNVGKLRRDAQTAIEAVKLLGEGQLDRFPVRLLAAVEYDKRMICDRCGTEMTELNCKITCPNCGNRFDCSDLTIYLD